MTRHIPFRHYHGDRPCLPWFAYSRLSYRIQNPKKRDSLLLGLVLLLLVIISILTTNIIIK